MNLRFAGVVIGLGLLCHAIARRCPATGTQFDFAPSGP
jgi:hypothetical protein